MAKNRNRYVCQECGHDEAKWLGHCPSCNSWNSFKEFHIQGSSKSVAANKSFKINKAQRLDKVEIKENQRLNTGLSEMDRLLGGGVMHGSTVLIGGEPGIGKSTLLLQMSCAMGKSKKVLYVSGEETAGQIKQRGQRLDLSLESTHLLCENRLEAILQICNEEAPDLLIIDSLQTLMTIDAGEVPGTVSQLKLCTSKLIQWTRKEECTLILVAHVTKEGLIAGPRTVEHLVDTVLYFEHSGDELRYLRAQKNRFGSTQELGLFLMEEKGLFEVNDPGSYFLEQRDQQAPQGTVTAAIFEGSRILLVEIQALTVSSQSSMSRVYSEKIDQKRISRIAAVLEKHIGLRFSDQDIYVHVAGGLKIVEPGADLPIALALYSARTGLVLNNSIISMGELSLSGEIKNIRQLERRVNAARDQGFKHYIIPGKQKLLPEAVIVKSLKDAIESAFNLSTEKDQSQV
ncbi:MAG: DNA repair protein RadA [Spirochaetaceae bacterium]|nr:DNA repair protein RadA [Spirochaetaceae bacterium]